MNTPLVTVAMPVCNGGAMFVDALNSVLEQDYANLEILVSDNGSTDETPDVAQKAARGDARVRYLRQDAFLPAFDHFLSLVSQARGEFFLWAAHDDLRSSDYVSGLLRGFDRSEVTLAFGDLDIMTVHGDVAYRKSYDFENTGLNQLARIRKQALMQCYHLYGLWRTARLASLPKPNCKWWPDLPLLMAAAATGYFRYVPGPAFRYYERPKSDAERALYQDGEALPVSKLKNVAALIMSSYSVMRKTAGAGAAILAAALVAEKNLRFAGVGLARRVRRFYSREALN